MIHFQKPFSSANLTNKASDETEVHSDVQDGSPDSKQADSSRKRRKLDKDLPASVEGIQKKPCDPKRKEILDRAVANFITESPSPVSFVQSDALKNFMKVVEASYTIPSEETTLSRLKAAYNKR